MPIYPLNIAERNENVIGFTLQKASEEKLYIVFHVQKWEKGGVILLSDSNTMKQMNTVIIQYHGYISNITIHLIFIIVVPLKIN